MSRKFIIALAVLTFLLLAAVVVASGQTTTVTRTVQKPDGTYSVIE